MRVESVLINKLSSVSSQKELFDEFLSSFSSALSSRNTETIKAMWEENPLLQAWHSGQPVNFGTADMPDLRVISLDALVNNFKAVLASQTPYIIQAIWERNLLLQAFYNGQSINVGTADVTDLRVISLDELINNFKAALSSRAPYITKAMWEGSPLLQAWYSGQPVNFGTEQSPDLQVISLDALVNNFKAVLASQTPYIIQAIWERNPLLQAWYSGQYVNFGTADVPDLRIISLDVLANNFKAVLASHCKDIIKAMWEGNPLLQAWYSGQRVNFGTEQTPNLRVISLDALANNFKAVLASHCKDIIKAMWERNPLLQVWYSGQRVNVRTADAPDFRVITLDELVNNFKAVLASHCKDIIKALWEGNSLLQAWYSGQPVNFGTADVPDLRVISLDVLVNNFKAVLASHCKDIIKAMWERNPLLQAWYSGQPVNFGTADVPDLQVISLDELVNNFKAVLASQAPDIIKAMWEENPLLQAWYSGQPVNFGTADVPDLRVISLEGLVNNFKAVLASQTPNIIQAMWEGNPLLQNWHSGQRVNVGTADAPDFRVISLDALINNFKAALASHCKDIVKAMWEGNYLLQDWHSGHHVNVGTADVPDFRVISLDALINNFKVALTSRVPYIIKAMWEGNPLLQAWYSGQPVNFGTADVPDFQIISLDALVDNFKAALSSHCKDIIKALWEGNTALHNAIEECTFEHAALILKKVLASSQNGSSLFIRQYVSYVTNRELISAVLADITNNCKNKKLSTYKANQIKCLKNRLSALLPEISGKDSVFLYDRDVIPAASVVQEITNSKLKRKSIAKSQPNKNSKKHTRTSLSSLVESASSQATPQLVEYLHDNQLNTSIVSKQSVNNSAMLFNDPNNAASAISASSTLFFNEQQSLNNQPYPPLNLEPSPVSSPTLFRHNY